MARDHWTSLGHLWRLVASSDRCGRHQTAVGVIRRLWAGRGRPVQSAAPPDRESSESSRSASRLRKPRSVLLCSHSTTWLPACVASSTWNATWHMSAHGPTITVATGGPVTPGQIANTLQTEHHAHFDVGEFLHTGLFIISFWSVEARDPGNTWGPDLMPPFFCLREISGFTTSGGVWRAWHSPWAWNRASCRNLFISSCDFYPNNLNCFKSEITRKSPAFSHYGLCTLHSILCSSTAIGYLLHNQQQSTSNPSNVTTNPSPNAHTPTPAALVTARRVNSGEADGGIRFAGEGEVGAGGAEARAAGVSRLSRPGPTGEAELQHYLKIVTHPYRLTRTGKAQQLANMKYVWNI